MKKRQHLIKIFYEPLGLYPAGTEVELGGGAERRRANRHQQPTLPNDLRASQMPPITGKTIALTYISRSVRKASTRLRSFQAPQAEHDR